MKNNISKVLKKLNEKEKISMLEDFGRKYSKFEILISTILSARSKDETTIPIAEELFKRYNTLKRHGRHGNSVPDLHIGDPDRGEQCVEFLIAFHGVPSLDENSVYGPGLDDPFSPIAIARNSARMGP